MITVSVSVLCFFSFLFYSGNAASVTIQTVDLRTIKRVDGGLPKNKFQELLEASTKIVDLKQLITNYRPDEENVYYFVSRRDPYTAHPVLLGRTDLLSATGYDPGKRTVLLVHGWLGSVAATFSLTVADAYLKAEDVNIIILDWYAGSRHAYANAVANTVRSGESAARFMNWLSAVTGSTPDSWHIIGHSLGGHQVGVIGRNINGTVAYITGLDPAMPLWMTNPNQLRASDSAYTEVIHTNVGLAGHPTPLGHVDIYPNGGRGQPGCDGQSCDHDRCFHLMADSLTGGGLHAVQCISYLSAIMGLCSLNGKIRLGGPTPKTGTRGVYYLVTNSAAPFSHDT